MVPALRRKLLWSAPFVVGGLLYLANPTSTCACKNAMHAAAAGDLRQLLESEIALFAVDSHFTRDVYGDQLRRMPEFVVVVDAVTKTGFRARATIDTSRMPAGW